MLESTDFTGLYKIAQDNNTADILAAYIEKYEQKYLIDLLGFELYELFIDDLDVSDEPQTARFVTIYEPLNYAPNGAGEPNFIPIEFSRSRNGRSLDPDIRSEIVPTYSEGILKMLKGFIYFEFVKEYGYQVAQTGIVTNKDENSDPLPGAKMLGLIESRYNEAIASYQVIRNYIMANASTYPEFDGVEKKTTHWGGSF